MEKAKAGDEGSYVNDPEGLKEIYQVGVTAIACWVLYNFLYLSFVFMSEQGSIGVLKYKIFYFPPFNIITFVLVLLTFYSK